MEIEHVTIDMDVPGEISVEKNSEKNTTGEEGEDMQRKIQEMLQEVPENPLAERTIFRVPAWFHEAQRGLFEPRMVSIGPYHRGKESLRFMEEQKCSFLRDFLAAGKNVSIEVYIQEIKALEQRARRCYSENVDMKSDDFVMMLLLDGCFLLEHFIRLSRFQDSAHCNVVWAAGNLHSDMFLLENQIPFFVIHKLFAIQGGTTDNCEGFNCPLLSLLFNTTYFLPEIIRSATGKPPEVSCTNIHHFLHLRYICRVGNNQINQENQAYEELTRDTTIPPLWMDDKFVSAAKKHYTSPKGIPCASMLHEAGVTFRRKKSPRDRFDISFNNGIMEIPFFSLSYFAKILFANEAAFEQTQGFFLSQPPITSYLALMDYLINTEEDVAILERNGILDDKLPSQRDAADFFNDLGELFDLEKFSSHYLLDEIRKYSNSTWHKQRARLMRDYFSNPWSTISVGAAAILLILSVLQTYYSAKH